MLRERFKIDNPENSITFNKIINCLSNYFNINILATRLNYYTENDYKPLHHDSHAYTNGIKEDTTIGLSLGDPRTLIFKHVETCNTFYFPQNNGDIFCFDHLTNIKFQHGISLDGQLSSAVWNVLGPRFESPLGHVCKWYRSPYID